MKWIIKIFSLILGGCLIIGPASCRHQPPKSPSGDLPPWCRIYFSPEDHIPTLLISLIDSAEKKVWAAFYSFDLPEVADALLKAKDRGVDVRVAMDDQTARTEYSQGGILREHGILTTDLSPADLMHNKFMVIDGFITWTGSYNPSHTGTYRDDNNVVVIASRSLARNYEEEFLEMWKGTFGRDSPGSTPTTRFLLAGTVVENYFSPDDDCAGRIIELLRGARKSIHFAMFTFTLLPVAEAIVKKHNEGVEVKGVLEQGQNSPWNCFRLFEDCGLDVRWDQNLHYLHHKFLVIDGATVITGSFNPSKHARDANDENILVIHHPQVAARFLKEFDRLWERKWD